MDKYEDFVDGLLFVIGFVNDVSKWVGSVTHSKHYITGKCS